MTKVENLKELHGMLMLDLITLDEFERMRAELLFHPEPGAPLANLVAYRNPRTGKVVRISKRETFWYTFFFGIFYMLYKEAWKPALICLGIGTIGFIPYLGLPICIVLWIVFASKAYGMIVDVYREKGWVEVDPRGA